MKPLNILTASFVILASGLHLLAAPSTTSRYILVDQFGYRPGDSKVAVLADPQAGSNADDAYTPGSILEVRDFASDAVCFTGSPTVWNGGATHEQSGDRGWWFDFTSVIAEGSYYLYDPENEVGLYGFEIGEEVYADVLKAAMRMYFYNRCGVAKEEPYADPCWTDSVSFAGPGQDTEARDVSDKNNPDSAKDMSGGWFDAGDYNKYVTFLAGVIHQLLDAYTQNPDAWTDSANLPESENGLPDVLDEVLWGLDWLKKMQDMEDGGVHIKMGSISYDSGSPPSTDTRRRYYGPKCSSSSIDAAGMFGHAAIVLSEFPKLSGYVDDLTLRAMLAWTWYHDHPKSSTCDTQEIKSGDADRSVEEQAEAAVTAAVYLFALTGEKMYGDYVDENYNEIDYLGWWGPYAVERTDALLYYSQLPDANSSVANDILNRLTGTTTWMTDYFRQNDNDDLYRANMPDAQYHWGSNNVKANVGNLNMNVIFYNLDHSREDQYLEKALSCLHYMHGVNPLNKVYLSNMSGYDAENSADEIYHSWFTGGTKWDNVLTSECGPAPGYLPGGPNKSYSGSQPGISDQPPQKAYQDGNSYSNSWEITEPSCGYQSAYIKLLSKFVNNQTFSGIRSPGIGRQADEVRLFQNYPNPFNPDTRIRYTLDKAGPVRIAVYDLSGRNVRTLAGGVQSAGRHIVHWDGRGEAGTQAATGTYLIVLRTKETVRSQKVVLLR